MKSFFFTYGTDEGFPFQGGWTRVDAPDRIAAERVFQAIHPNRGRDNLLNCCSVYDKESFEATEMCRKGNLGRRCHEVITLQVTPVEECREEE